MDGHIAVTDGLKDERDSYKQEAEKAADLQKQLEKMQEDAKKFDEMEMSEIVDRKLGVIDLASAVLAMENHLPMLLFALNEEGSILKAVKGEKIGTLVKA